jgi:hypothetical protein
MIDALVEGFVLITVQGVAWSLPISSELINTLILADFFD